MLWPERPSPEVREQLTAKLTLRPRVTEIIIKSALSSSKRLSLFKTAVSGGKYNESNSRQRQPARKGLHLHSSRGGGRDSRRGGARSADLSARQRRHLRLHRLRSLLYAGPLRDRRQGQRISGPGQGGRRLRLRLACLLRLCERSSYLVHGPRLLRRQRRFLPQACCRGDLRAQGRHHGHVRPAQQILRHQPDAHHFVAVLEHGPRHGAGGRQEGP